MEENDVMVRERVTALESSVKSLHKRLDYHETLIEKMQEEVNTTQRLLVEMKHMREDINKIAEKVDEIEKKPAKNWQTIVTGLISAIVGGLGTLIVTKLIGG